MTKAVDIVNARGNPTYDQVEEILRLDCAPAACEKNIEVTEQLSDSDDFYVEERDPASYALLLGDKC